MIRIKRMADQILEDIDMQGGSLRRIWLDGDYINFDVFMPLLGRNVAPIAHSRQGYLKAKPGVYGAELVNVQFITGESRPYTDFAWYTIGEAP